MTDFTHDPNQNSFSGQAQELSELIQAGGIQNGKLPDDLSAGPHTDLESAMESQGKQFNPPVPQTDSEDAIEPEKPARKPRSRKSKTPEEPVSEPVPQEPEALPEDEESDTPAVLSTGEKTPRRAKKKIVAIDEERQVLTDADRIQNDLLDLVESMKIKRILTDSIRGVERGKTNPDRIYAVVYHGEFKVLIPSEEAIYEPDDYRGQRKSDVLYYMLNKRMGAEIDYVIRGVDPETGEEVFRHSSDSEPFAALAFKIATDPFVGKLCFFRVYSGTVNAGATVLNATKDNKERMGRIVQMHSNHRKDIETVYAGDIAAVVGLKNTTTGDTLCDEKAPVILESMEFPEPVIQLAIEPKTKAGQDKMGIALAKLAEEDPTFRAHTDQETGQTIIAGMGELHLEIIVDRLLREFKVEANVGAPQVSYKETIKGTADVDYKYKKQSGGSGQYGHVKIRVAPNESGKGYEFINKVVGGAIPKEYIPAVDAGIRGAMQAGILAGYEVVDVKVELYDGSYHEVDSSEMAFKIAGSIAFKEAMKQAQPILMEPIMKVSVTVPDDYTGTVIGDLSSRRGQIQGQEARPGSVQVDALVPLSEMFGYTSDLRSNTQGRGQYAMEPHSYQEVPKNIAEKIMTDRKK